jgi:hypothetical protein
LHNNKIDEVCVFQQAIDFSRLKKKRMKWMKWVKSSSFGEQCMLITKKGEEVTSKLRMQV